MASLGEIKKKGYYEIVTFFYFKITNYMRGKDYDMQSI